MVIRVNCSIIPFARDLKVCGDCFLLYCEGKGIAIFILIGILVPAVSFHFFVVLDDVVQVLSSDLVRVSDFASFPFRVDERVFTSLI